MRKEQEPSPSIQREIVSVSAPGGTRVRIASLHGVPNGRVDMQRILELRDIIRATPRYTHPGRAKG